MTKVKICGVKDMRDVEALNVLMPDFAGFVFASSKRQLTIPQAAALCRRLHPAIQKVGVFVNATKETMQTAKDACGLDILQLHGDEPPELCAALACAVWKAVRVQDARSLEDIGVYRAAAVVLDAYDKDAYGGMGKAFDWSLAAPGKLRLPVILAGGLDPENVRRAIEAVRPYAVDVSSGVETQDRKDFDKIRKFILEARKG